jgi:hypothetical protein
MKKLIRIVCALLGVIGSLYLGFYTNYPIGASMVGQKWQWLSDNLWAWLFVLVCFTTANMLKPEARPKRRKNS